MPQQDPYESIATPVQDDPYASIAAPVAAAPAAPAPTPGFFKEALAGAGRAVSAIAGLPKQILTPHDTLGATREDEVKMGPVGRLLYNPVADLGQGLRTAEAAREKSAGQGEGWAGQSLSFLENSPIGSIVSKAEEAGPGVVKFSPSTLGAATEGIGEFAIAPKAVEGLSKVGELRVKGMQGMARKVTGVESAVKKAVTDTAESHGEALETNKAKRAETMKQNLEAQRSARTDIDRQKMAIGDKNKGIEAENQAQAGKVKQREALAKDVDTQSKQLGERLSKVEQSVAKEANAKFDAVRAKIGNPETSPTELVQTVKSVEANVLQNIPENIKEFRAILSHEELPENIKGAAEAHGFDLEGTEPLTWNKLQSLKSRLDARLRNARNMNGDLKRALYQTRDAVVDNMGKLADANGAQGEWSAARDAWRQYKEDFHEGTGPSGSGSPVAQALNAEDPKNIRQPFLRTQSTIGNRGVDILRKYPQHGGSEAANHVENLVRNHESMQQLPSRGTPKPLKPTPNAFQLPGNKPLPARPGTPTVDLAKTAKDHIAQKAAGWGNMNARDIGILGSGVVAEIVMESLKGDPVRGVETAMAGAGAFLGTKYVGSRILNSPRVIEWLSKTPPEEAAALGKIPGADKVKIVDGLTQVAIKNRVPLSPVAKALLGPANVTRIAVASQLPQNRKEALDRLGKGGPKGLKVKGNIDLSNRPVLHNEDESISTERSFSIGTDEGEVLIPRIFDGKDHTEQEAIEHYRQTGQHMGIFETPEDADAYAEQVHNRFSSTAQ